VKSPKDQGDYREILVEREADRPMGYDVQNLGRQQQAVQDRCGQDQVSEDAQTSNAIPGQQARLHLQHGRDPAEGRGAVLPTMKPKATANTIQPTILTISGTPR
jgi:hypothetical protein